MFSVENMSELLVQKQKEHLGKDMLESRDNAGISFCDRLYIAETSCSIEEIEPISIRITNFHAEKRSIIVKAEENPRKPRYFTRVHQSIFAQGLYL